MKDTSIYIDTALGENIENLLFWDALGAIYFGGKTAENYEDDSSKH